MAAEDLLLKALSDIHGKLGRIDVTLAEQHVTLQEHQRRSLANEEGLAEIRKEITPLKTHVAVFGAVVKAALTGVAVLGTMVGVALGLLRVFGGLSWRG